RLVLSAPTRRFRRASVSAAPRSAASRSGRGAAAKLHGPADLLRRDDVHLAGPTLESGRIRECGFSDVGDRLTGEKSLVAGDQDVREGEQPGEYVVLNHGAGEVLVEEIGLLLVDV